MNRSLVAAATAAWIAPLIGVAAAWLYQTSSHGPTPGLTGGERTLGIGIASMLLGVVAGCVAFGAVFLLVRSCVPAGRLVPTALVDGLGIAGWVIWGVLGAMSNAEHEPPTYPGYQATLDVEVRAPKEMKSSFFVTIGAGASSDTKGEERIEGDFRILPVELNVRSLHAWAIHLMRDGPENCVSNYWFDLALPASPAGEVPWSEWIAPAVRAGYSVSDEISIRYRWRLSPLKKV